MNAQKRLLLAIVIVAVWFTVLFLALPKAHAASLRQKLADRAAAELRGYHQQLKVLRITRETEPGFLLAEDAYTHAIGDLEDFEAGDPQITEERLRNDLLEVEMDISEFGEGIAWMKTSN